MEPNNRPSTPWASGHIGGHQTIGKRTIYSLMGSMSKSILTPKRLVLRSLELPLTSSLASAFRHLPSVVCRRIQGTGEAGDELDVLTLLTILPTNGRGMAEEWRINGVQNLALKPSRDGERLPSTLQCSGQVSGVQTMEKFRNSLQFSSPTMAELLLFTFATVLA